MPANSQKNAPQETSEKVIHKADAPISELEAEPLPTNGIEVQALAIPVMAEDDTAQAAEQGEEPITGPLEEAATGARRSTTPLQETSEAPRPTLEVKSIVGDRYKVVTLLGSPHGTNVYRVTDTQGYRQCWACGSSASMEGDVYCVECGAQLTDRYYRLQEFAMPVVLQEDGSAAAAPTVLPSAILENLVPGTARVYDFFNDIERNRAYVVWEEVYGRAMASWLPAADGTDTLVAVAPPAVSGQLLSMDAPGDEQALAWMAQAADTLAALHVQGIVNCNIGLNNLVVQPGDRVILLDLTGCRSIPDTEGSTEPLSARASDLRNLAAELERWYLAIREEDHPTGTVAPEDVGEGMVSMADEITGPLSSPTNPSMVFARVRDGAFASAEEFAQALYDLYDASRPITNIQLWSGRASDVGQVRQINEDSVLTLEASVIEHEGILPIGLYVVADGMGGHQSGEVASSIAARTIGALVNTSLIAPLVAGDPVACDAATCAYILQQAVIEANRRIYDLAQERHSDLGTTVTAALVVGNQLTVANVGDSRTYLWRDGELAVITKDHSLVAQLVAAGQITPNEVYSHPRRNEIYRALGDPHLTSTEVDTFTHLLQPGDAILLCSDGLWDFVRDPIINALIGSKDDDPQQVCQALIDRANSMGGEDNISTIFVRIVPPRAEDEA